MIRDRETGLPITAAVSRATAKDLRTLGRDWRFDWKRESRGADVYKLAAEGPPSTLGLIALIRREGYVEVSLLESSPPNVGRGKRCEGIAGTLLAFAAELSSGLGNGGFLLMSSKSRLVEHYCKTYGFERIGVSLRLILDRDAARTLVRAYLGKEI